MRKTYSDNYPFLSLYQCQCVQYFHVFKLWYIWLPMFMIFNVCMVVGTCNGAQRSRAVLTFYNLRLSLRLRESALKVDSGRNSPCHTMGWNPHHSCSLLFTFSFILCQLSLCSCKFSLGSCCLSKICINLCETLRILHQWYEICVQHNLEVELAHKQSQNDGAHNQQTKNRKEKACLCTEKWKCSVNLPLAKSKSLNR